MINSTVRLIQPDPEAHLQPIAQLAAEAFTNGQYVDQFCQNYIGNSHYDWQASRVIFDGDKLVHHWGVWGYAMRVEAVQLQVGGVGAVATHADYRKQGWMHQAAQASFDAMKQAGYDLSILRGRHYAKMGYARAWNYVTYRLKAEEIPAAAIQQPYQLLALEQVSEMDRLYNQTHAGFTGTAVRPTFRNRHPDDMGVYAWFEAQGKLEGYVRAFPDEQNPKELSCLEATGDPQQGLAVLNELFRSGAYESLGFFTLPHDHPMLQQLRRGACIVEDRYFDVSGWRVRLINLQQALHKLIPLLEKRLAQSQFAGWQGSLRLEGGEQAAALHIDQGKVEISSDADTANLLCGGQALGRLLIGSDDPDEIIQQEEMACHGLARPLSRTLFPNLHPMMSHWDEY